MDKMRELVDLLNKYAREYYELDAPSVSDREYDALYDELKRMEEETGVRLPDSPTRRVGGEPISAFKKHNHIERLYSLDKAVTKEELEAFDQRVRKVCEPTYTVEYKFDGLTVCLTFDNGVFVRGTTRGNGVTGEDVTAQVLKIKSFPLSIPYKGLLEVQGEAIIRLSVLEKYNETASEPLKNARNAVAGAIRNLDPKETEKRKPEILFYNVNHISENFLKTQKLKEKFLEIALCDGLELISDETCLPYIVCTSAKGLRGEVIQHMLEGEGIIVGTGSACSSRHRHSRILTNCGYSADILDGALRISFSDTTTEDEVVFAAEKLKQCVKKLGSVMLR